MEKVRVGRGTVVWLEAWAAGWVGFKVQGWEGKGDTVTGTWFVFQVRQLYCNPSPAWWYGLRARKTRTEFSIVVKIIAFRHLGHHSQIGEGSCDGGVAVNYRVLSKKD